MKRAARWMIALGLIAAAGGVVAASFVVVDETEFVVVTSFGRIVAVYGDEPGETGLHCQGSMAAALAIDRRVRVFEPPPREVITGDKRNLEVASYVVWRVADPVLFLRTSGTHELAEARLYERVSAGQSDVIGRRELSALASTDPARWALDDLTREVIDARRARGTKRAGRRGARRPDPPVQPPGRGSPGRLRADPQRAPAGGGAAAGRGGGAVHHDHQPGRPRARHDPGPGRRRGRADPRRRRGRGDPHAQRGPRARPQVLRVPPHARRLPLDLRRADDRRAVVDEPDPEAPGPRPADRAGGGVARGSSTPPGMPRASHEKAHCGSDCGSASPRWSR